MNLINIYEPKAVIVIEKHTDNAIKQSSNLFCGACGRIVAIVRETLEFPFRFDDLKRNSNSFFLFENEEGCSCSRCHSHLFEADETIQFTTLEVFEVFQKGAFGRVAVSKMQKAIEEVKDLREIETETGEAKVIKLDLEK